MTSGEIPCMTEPGQIFESRYKDSKFVKVEEKNGILVEMRYPKMGLKYAERDCLLREEAYEKLLTVQESLPKGYHLKIWDAWRPFLLQEELYELYYSQIVRRFRLENAADEEKISVVRRYVSIPCRSEYEYPVHTSGGAVDVTLADCHGKDLAMGTAFDEMAAASQTDYFESTENSKIKNNRRLLYNAMTSAGFTNLPSEWWHYDYGDRFWAFYQKKPIIYKAAYARGDVDVDEGERE